MNTLLKQEKLQHLNSIAHEGKVLLLATHADGKIWYTVKQDGFEDSYLNTPADQRTGWENWQLLELPDEVDDPSVVDKEKAELTYQQDNSKFILRSRYKTREESAIAPVQLVSAGGHLYVFRQSKSNTLLVDRFVLDGMTNQLSRKLEVRFKRSRQKHKPTEEMKMGATGLQNVDSVDYRDADGNFFYEPTTELTLIDNLKNGWFSVVQVLTNEHEKYRWHIFAYNSQTQQIELTTIRTSDEGLFDVKDYVVLEPQSELDPTLVPRNIPGVIRRAVAVNGVKVTNGLSATKYDLQQEQQTKAGPQLLRTATRVMLAIPTDKGTASISFAISSDGTLSQINETPTTTLLRSQVRDVLLPLNTLDAIKAFADITPTPKGIITGFTVGTAKEDAEDKVKVTSDQAASLETGDEVEIRNTQSYDGLYRASKIDDNSFTVDHTPKDLGNWEKVEEEGGLVFEGMITAYEKLPDGKLKVTAYNHGLENGDEVQIEGTSSYNDTFPIKKIDEAHFVIERSWAQSEAVNVRLEALKRRGIILDGKDDYIALPAMEINYSQGFTVEVWVKYNSFKSWSRIIDFGNGENQDNLILANAGTSNALVLSIRMGSSEKRLDASNVLVTGQWMHVAATVDKTGKGIIYVNGKVVQSGMLQVPASIERTKNYVGKSAWSSDGYLDGQVADLRIWQTARTDLEIRNNMHLQLTGKEVDLVGYWRLGAISEGKERKVIDFAVDAHDGVVYGDAYVGGITLSRNSRDGTPAVKFSNDELVAVSQRATYIEEFEFKVTPAMNVNNADGTGKKIFQMSYWGKASRSANDKVAIAVVPDNFVDLGNGWYRASCQFIIPDGVAMLRSFEIGNLVGTWNTLEIRKHRIRLISDAISQANFAEAVNLATIADNQLGSIEQLRTLDRLEQMEAPLVKERTTLKEEIAELTMLNQLSATELQAQINLLNASIATQTTLCSTLIAEVNALQVAYNTEVDNPLNYECYITVLVGSSSWKRLHVLNQNTADRTPIIRCVGDGNRYRFIPIPSETSSTDADKSYNMQVLVSSSWISLHVLNQNDADGTPIIIHRDGGNPVRLTRKNANEYNLSVGVPKTDVGSWKGLHIENQSDSDGTNLLRHRDTGNTFNITKTATQINTVIPNAKTRWDEKRGNLTTEQATLDYLTKKKDNLMGIQDVLNKKNQRLTVVTTKLKTVQDGINVANTAYVNALSVLQNTPQTMPVLHAVSQGYQKGLETRGTLLGFVRPASRLTAIETCEGNVQLSYFDTQGRMRQTNYDATSDSKNITFEQWIPDGLKSCLNFNSTRGTIAFNSTLYFEQNWSVEAWFAYPFAENLQWFVLTNSEDNQQQIVAFRGKYLGVRVNGLFYDSGFNFEQLFSGWHHLTVVGSNQKSKILFYIDGKQVGSIRMAALSQTAIELDGTNDFIALPAMDIDYSKGFTVEAWVKYEGFQSNSRIIDFGNGAGQNNIVLGNEGSSKDLIFSVTNSGIEKKLTAVGVLEQGQWVHLAAVVDTSNKVLLYKNGQLVQKADSQLPQRINRTQNYIGKSNWSTHGIFDGLVKEVRVWNRERTQLDLQTMMGKTLKGDEAGLVANWYVDKGAVNDKSSAKRNGTVNGDPQTIDPSTTAVMISNVRTIGYIADSTQTVAPVAVTTTTTANTAMGFSGTNSYVSIPAHTNPTQAITVSCWAKSNTDIWNNCGMLVSKRDAFIIHPEANSKGLNMYFHVGGSWKFAGFMLTVDITQWHHYTGTFDGTTIRLFVDGVQVAQSSATGQINADTGVLTIGMDDGDTSRCFNGQVAEVHIWNKARTESEIQSDMAKTLMGNEAGLVGYWPLADGSAKDYSASNLNGTLNGTVTTVSFDKVSKNVPPVVTNTAMGLNGTNSYVSIPAHTNPTQAMTVSCWAKSNTATWNNSSMLISKRDAFIIHPDANSKGLTMYFHVSGGWKAAGFTLTIDITQWHHYVGTFDGTAIRLFVDGTRVAESNTTGQITADTGVLTIGMDDGSANYFNGQIAEVRIWNKARTESEIQSDMAKALIGNEAGLVGYWPLSDGSAKDYSASGLNGTINGTVTTVPFDKVLKNSSTAVSRTFGKLTELRFWNIALSEEEIAVNAKTLLSGNEPGLSAYYPMNEAKGTEIRDYSGNNRHGTLLGANWWGCSAPIGNLGHSVIQFDGINDHLETPYMAALNPTQFTLTCWVKVQGGAGTYRSVITSRTASPQKGYMLYATDNNTWQFWVGNGSSWVTATGSSIIQNTWTHLAATYDGSKMRFYINGALVSEVASTYAVNSAMPLRIGAGITEGNPQFFFSGQIAEVCIWNKACTQEDLQSFMYKSLTGKETGLVGYWPLNELRPEGSIIKAFDLAGTYHCTVREAIVVQDNTLPIGGDALVSTEYNTIGIEPATGKKMAMMRRFFASPTLNGANVLPEKRIEQLQLLWIGNAQFAPTLLGYIEGAPPIPSENLTEQPDYSGATAVELTMSEDVDFSWHRSQESGLGASFDAFIGADVEGYAGLGWTQKTVDVRAGFKGNLDTSYQFINESNITSSSSLSMTDRLELRGSPEQTPKFPHLGNRFIPKNVGYALVISGLADVFITKLARSSRMIGYQVQPVEGVPPDVNTITFLMNPAYTMQGSLDGMTGSRATSQRFFKHVPQMRSQYGSLYPASYYRLMEAYNLKQQIEQEDKRRESYFAQFNTRLIDELSLARETESGAAPQTIGVAREEDKSSTQMTDEERKAQDKALLEQQQKESAASSKQQSAAAKKKQAEIDSQITDMEKRTHASDCFAGWQRTMENIQIRAGKRNIVNTYVWDADGGLRTESQSFANTAEHTIGGSFSLNAGLGFEGAIGAGGFKAELTALVTVNMTQTMTKTESRSKGIQLNVDLSGVEHTGITDYNDYPMMPGEKVDRYRFMSFFLDNSTNNFHDFFSYVVDPEWLRSNDEEARALRQAMGKANKTWRVLHRVTYVERPALMGFGRDMRKVEGLDGVTKQILDYFDLLESRHQALMAENRGIKVELQATKSEVTAMQTKLDAILNLLKTQ